MICRQEVRWDSRPARGGARVLDYARGGDVIVVHRGGVSGRLRMHRRLSITLLDNVSYDSLSATSQFASDKPRRPNDSALPSRSPRIVARLDRVLGTHGPVAALDREFTATAAAECLASCVDGLLLCFMDG